LSIFLGAVEADAEDAVRGFFKKSSSSKIEDFLLAVTTGGEVTVGAGVTVAVGATTGVGTTTVGVGVGVEAEAEAVEGAFFLNKNSVSSSSKIDFLGAVVLVGVLEVGAAMEGVGLTGSSNKLEADFFSSTGVAEEDADETSDC
jgi:hypothetical protein